MKRASTVILISFFAFISAFAQSSDFRRNIGLDSLVRIMQQNSQQKIYYNRDESGLLTFTVDASSPTLQDDISRLLRDKGYIISHSEGVLFVLKGTPVKESLPSGWFVIESEKKDEEVEYQDLLGATDKANYQNKVYQIGEKNNQKGSQAYLSGYVRDSRTGEPAIGVTIAHLKSSSFAQSATLRE